MGSTQNSALLKKTRVIDIYLVRDQFNPLLYGVRPPVGLTACIPMVICEICLVNQKKFYL